MMMETSRSSYKIYFYSCDVGLSSCDGFIHVSRIPEEPHVNLDIAETVLCLNRLIIEFTYFFNANLN